tara:strand:- start:137 stop:931 length:795 start_codon:yes stop_codon:yes gene_type:complete
MEFLFHKVYQSPYINSYIGIDLSHDKLPSNLEIAADGPNSYNRNRKGIGVVKYPYKAACLTVQVLIRGLKPLEAFEILRPEGPLALLPMGGDRFQVVLTAPLDKCIELTSVPDSIFLDRLSTILPYGFEPDIILDQVSYFPLELIMAKSLYKDNLLLVGESAHRFHPVGGQGLNVCWRDVNCLIKMIDKNTKTKTIDIPNLSSSYSINRYLDILIVALLTHLMILIYSNSNFLLKIARYPLFPFMNRFKFLRRFVLKIMTDGFV